MNKDSVTAAINGDRQAVEAVIKSHYSQLYKTAFLYVKNEADALDILQDSMVKIIQQIQQLRQPEYFTTWAVRIVIHSALDFLKKKRPEAWQEEMAYATPEQPLSHEERLDIYNGLGRLPEHLREITVLYYFHGQKVQEIADILDEPAGTVKYKLHEARKLLKDYLKGGNDDGLQ